MELADKIKELSARFYDKQTQIKTEEATKHSLIMPMIAALGYDVFNPSEVVPEFIADTGIKKNEKVDYVIKKNGNITIIIECKWCGADLNKEHKSQLYRYFAVTEAKFAILTNGLIYEFYSDIDKTNTMDSKPFFIFNVLDFQAYDIDELTKFTKETFSLKTILTTANTLKYTSTIKSILEKELSNPSESFVRFFASQVTDSRLTKSIIDQFTMIVKQARGQFINTKINERLKYALTNDTPKTVDELVTELSTNDKGIITTDAEIEAYHIVKAILRQTIDSKRIIMRDTKSYCGILLDNNNRKPVCRLRFNYSQKYLGIFVEKKETRHPIDSIDDIFNYSEQIISTVTEYE